MGRDNIIQLLPIDAHKIAADIQFEHPGLAGIVRRAFPHRPLQALDAIQGPLPSPTGVTVVDKLRFEDGRQVIVHQVMDHPVPEGCRKDFPLDGVADDKTDTSPDLVAQLADIIL